MLVNVLKRDAGWLCDNMLDWCYEREAEPTVCQGCSFKRCVTGMVMELFDRHAELSV